MKRIRSAVIGCGYQGTSLIRNLNALEQCDLRVICDLEQERLAKVGLNWPSVKISTNAKAVCTDPTIDAVVICTPSHTHYGLASMALAAGKHVLVEKPLTHSVETAERLVEQAKQKGRVSTRRPHFHPQRLCSGNWLNYQPRQFRRSALFRWCICQSRDVSARRQRGLGSCPPLHFDDELSHR